MNRYITGLSAVALFAWGGPSVDAALVGYWPFDEGTGTTTEDVAGSNDGTFVNLTADAWDTGNFAPVAGNTASIEFGNILNSPGLNNFNGYVHTGNLGVSGDATVTLWVNADQYISDVRLFSQVGGGPGDTSVAGATGMNPNGNLAVSVWSGGAWNTLSPANPFPISTWHHLAFVYQGGTVTLFLDGNQQFSGAANFDFDSAIEQMGIAARYQDTYGNAWDGHIDDVSVWNEALGEEQIDLLATGATPLSLVPEPASLSLLSAGGLLAFRRRRA